MQIIIPKRFVGPTRISGLPFFFLAGPIRGGDDWQREMCHHLTRLAPSCVIASPCRWADWQGGHPLARFFIEGKEDMFPHQLDWERYYMQLAGMPLAFPDIQVDGCVIFWLPLESTHQPHPGPEPYAMDTRGELGRWSVHKSYNPNVRMVVGAHPNFLGLSQIKRNLSADMGYEFPVHSAMQSTALAAFLEAKRRT